MGPPFAPLAIDAVLSDVDGVVRRWGDTMERLDQAYGLPTGTVAAAAFAPSRLLPAITGRVEDAEWRAGVAAALAARCGGPERSRDLVAAWSAQVGTVDPDVLALFAALPPEVPIVLVSNGTTRLEADLAALGVTAVVDAVVNSARVGVAKPDAAIFRFAARRAGAALDRCLYIDDRPDHVETARQLGMVGVEYRDVATLHSVLSDLWVPRTAPCPAVNPPAAVSTMPTPPDGSLDDIAAGG